MLSFVRKIEYVPKDLQVLLVFGLTFFQQELKEVECRRNMSADVDVVHEGLIVVSKVSFHKDWRDL